MARSRSRHGAIEIAARQLRELQKAEHDEIAAAQRALREAAQAHHEARERAAGELRSATAAWPIAAYGHSVILFEDRLSTPGGTHALTPAITARIEEPAGEHHLGRRQLELRIEEPGWTETVRFPRHDESLVRELARKIEAVAEGVEVARSERRVQARAAERGIAAAEEDQRGIEEAHALVHRLGELCEDDEDVLEMAPGVSAGHEGVLVATDRRLLFVSMRRTLSLPYGDISSVTAKGRWFGSRLAVSTAEGKLVLSGVPQDLACAMAALVRERKGEQAATAV